MRKRRLNRDEYRTQRRHGGLHVPILRRYGSSKQQCTQERRMARKWKDGRLRSMRARNMLEDGNRCAEAQSSGENHAEKKRRPRRCKVLNATDCRRNSRTQGRKMARKQNIEGLTNYRLNYMPKDGDGGAEAQTREGHHAARSLRPRRCRVLSATETRQHTESYEGGWITSGKGKTDELESEIHVGRCQWVSQGSSTKLLAA